MFSEHCFCKPADVLTMLNSEQLLTSFSVRCAHFVLLTGHKSTTNQDSSGSGSSYSTLTIATILVLVLGFALCLSKLLEMLGVFNSPWGADMGQLSGSSKHASLALNDFNTTPQKGAARDNIQPHGSYASSSRNMCSTACLYGWSVLRTFALWLSSDSLSSGAAGAAGPTNVGGVLKWGKAQSHTV